LGQGIHAPRDQSGWMDRNTLLFGSLIWLAVIGGVALYMLMR
jgi:hypothetical protein